MTGSFSPDFFAGVQTSRYRQSSLAEMPGAWLFSDAGFCMQADANAVACFTPDQDLTGCGAFHRRSPTGGAAKGMPLNVETSFATVPATRPPVTFASAICAVAGAAIASAI